MPRIVTQSRTVSNQYSVEHLSSMMAELQNRRTQLLAKFRPDDRLVQEAENEITNTQAALEKATRLTGSEQSTDVNPLHQTLEIEMAKEQGELAGIEARRQSLLQQAKTYRRQLMKLGNATAEYDDLARNQKEAEENYLLYSRKTEEARIAESLDKQKIANVAIAETPSESHVPSKPNVRLNLASGDASGTLHQRGQRLHRGVLSNAGARGAPCDLMDGHTRLGKPSTGPLLLDTVQLPSELEALTGLPTLAVTWR